ncbi:DUF4760 domain-containing protein [Amycolatopsis pretoriensis]|uniref:DUF4760 domain-containing protein n=1 Tax=Amycolatopsis pretoriensis TaxID=218821 RepID=UPI00115FCE7F|nr:hypothetical protein [Amycolatopsis pretoriensis]
MLIKMGATLVSLISPVVAVAIAVWGFGRTTKADRLKAFFDIQERYLSPEVREGRKLIYSLAGTAMDDLTPHVATKISTALAVMNSIAIAAEAGYVDRKLVAQSMGRSFTAAVHTARPYVDHLESLRGFRPFPFAERLANQLNKAGHVAEGGN